MKCPQCDSTFRWRSGFDSHLKQQHVGQYKCLECRWSFKTNEQLKEHIKYLHSDYEDSRKDSKTDTDANKSEGEETYYEKDTTVTQSDTESNSLFETKLICKNCNKQFTQNSNLTRHIQNIHSNNGHKRKSLATIEQGQTKVLKSEHQCHQCKKSYVNKFNLNRHITRFYVAGLYYGPDVVAPLIVDPPQP